MATAYAPFHVTIGGLLLRSRAIDCDDWSDLLRDPPKRGGNRTAAQQHGTKHRGRWRHQLRAALPVRIDGAYDQDNLFHPGTDADHHARAYAHLAALQTIVQETGEQPLIFTWPDGSVETVCVVEERTEPDFSESHRICRVVLDVTVKDGALDLAGALE